MTAADLLFWLEGLRYMVRTEGNGLNVRYQGDDDPPLSTSDLAALLRPRKGEIMRLLQDRAEGKTFVPDGVLVAYGEDVIPLARKIKAALDRGELWDAWVFYSRSVDRAEFRFQPAEWEP